MIRKLMVVFVPVLIAGLMFLGGCQRPTPEKIADHVVGELTKKLDLNEAQQQQLNAIKVELLQKGAELKKSKEAIHSNFMAKLEKDTLDKTELKKMFATQKAEFDSIGDMLIDRLSSFHATLNPEQKKKLVEYLKEKGDSHRRCFAH
ncbi:MAG: Spy/CpxP family protein refolding chaperone [Pelobacteraceae bacterium]